MCKVRRCSHKLRRGRVAQPHVVFSERVLNTCGVLAELWCVRWLCGAGCCYEFVLAAYFGMILGVILFHAQVSAQPSPPSSFRSACALPATYSRPWATQ